MGNKSDTGGANQGIQVTLWGTRGSCPAPFRDQMAYGGNTSCVSVGWKEGCAVFDGGTGIAAFGKWLEKETKDRSKGKQVEVAVFVSHVHLDHVMGIPMLPCLFWKEAAIHFYGPAGEGDTFRQRLSRVLGPPYWPVAVDETPARIVWHDVGPETRWQLPGGARVQAMRSGHPNGGFLYRLDYEGQSVVYGLDCELGEDGGPETAASGHEESGKRKLCASEQEEAGKLELDASEREKTGNPETQTLQQGEPGRRVAPVPAQQGLWQQYREFARDCSLLIFDGAYTKDNYGQYRGFGHSYWQQGLEMAKSCNAGRLCICHHEWSEDDEGMAGKDRELKRLAKDWGRPAEFAREGTTICLGGGDGEKEGFHMFRKAGRRNEG